MTLQFTPSVAPEIFDLRPDYTAICVVADGIEVASRHPAVERFVEATRPDYAPPPWADDHLEAWRTAYRAFGAKPQRTPCSAEALMMRMVKDHRLPTINPVVDLYNAVSVRYAIPIGGESIAGYVGSPRLTRSIGTEAFDTTKDGQSIREIVPSGEVVWTDDRGVTCRRWNWRQGIRTRIDFRTTRAWFVLERLDPMPVNAALDGAAALMEILGLMSPAARFTARLIDRYGTTEVLDGPKASPPVDCGETPSAQ
jgi:DNA/RNA-binding domain of Phe-tRNA-synthetase-like protein